MFKQSFWKALLSAYCVSWITCEHVWGMHVYKTDDTIIVETDPKHRSLTLSLEGGSLKTFVGRCDKLMHCANILQQDPMTKIVFDNHYTKYDHLNEHSFLEENFWSEDEILVHNQSSIDLDSFFRSERVRIKYSGNPSDHDFPEFIIDPLSDSQDFYVKGFVSFESYWTYAKLTCCGVERVFLPLSNMSFF